MSALTFKHSQSVQWKIPQPVLWKGVATKSPPFLLQLQQDAGATGLYCHIKLNFQKCGDGPPGIWFSVIVFEHINLPNSVSPPNFETPTMHIGTDSSEDAEIMVCSESFTNPTITPDQQTMIFESDLFCVCAKEYVDEEDGSLTVALEVGPKYRCLAVPSLSSVYFSEFCSGGALRAVYDSQKYVDFEIVVTTSDSKVLPVHKAVLATQSAAFEAMFEVEMTEKTGNRLEIKDFQAEAVECFVKCLYGCAKLEKCEKHSADLLQLADKYQVLSLKAAAENWLCEGLDPAVVCNRLALAHLHGAIRLKKCCIDFIIGHKSKICGSQEFVELKKNYASLISDILNADDWFLE